MVILLISTPLQMLDAMLPEMPSRGDYKERSWDFTSRSQITANSGQRPRRGKVQNHKHKWWWQKWRYGRETYSHCIFHFSINLILTAVALNPSPTAASPQPGEEMNSYSVNSVFYECSWRSIISGPAQCLSCSLWQETVSSLCKRWMLTMANIIILFKKSR